MSWWQRTIEWFKKYGGIVLGVAVAIAGAIFLRKSQQGPAVEDEVAEELDEAATVTELEVEEQRAEVAEIEKAAVAVNTREEVEVEVAKTAPLEPIAEDGDGALPELGALDALIKDS